MKNIAIYLTTLLLTTSNVALADTPKFDQDGVYRIPFGTAAAPILPCSPDKVCSIQFEENEIIFDKVSGDTTSWQIVSGISGPKANVPILFFKPNDVGTVADPITTNLIITTNRRTYEVRLQAVRLVSRTRYGFTYGAQSMSTNNNTPMAVLINKTIQDEANAKPSREAGNLLAPQIQTTTSTPAPTTNSWALDHAYRVSGNVEYKPVAVWNDGVRTYVQMPRNALTPSFYSQPANGPQEIVNIHGPINDIYAIDGLPSHIVLIGSVGKKAPHIDIYRVQ